MITKDVETWQINNGLEFLSKIGIKPGQKVLDFGCNVGHYTIPLAKVVGNKGTVYALDKDNDALTTLMRIAKEKTLGNIVPMKTKGDIIIECDDEMLDAVLLYDVLHYLERRHQLLNEVHRILKLGALLLVYPKHHKHDDPFWSLADIELDELIREIEKADFQLVNKSLEQLLHDDSLNKGYILNFMKGEQTSTL